MYHRAHSRLSFPLHEKNIFISAFNAILVLGVCDYKGKYLFAFEFLLVELLPLYNCILNWMKVFSESAEASIRGIILTKGTQVYSWKKTIVNNDVFIVISLERDDSVIFELKFNYENFNKFVQALYFLTWEAMSLKDTEMEVLLKLMPLTFSEMFELKESSKQSRTYKLVNTGSCIFHIIGYRLQ